MEERGSFPTANQPNGYKERGLFPTANQPNGYEEHGLFPTADQPNGYEPLPQRQVTAPCTSYARQYALLQAVCGAVRSQLDVWQSRWAPSIRAIRTPHIFSYTCKYGLTAGCESPRACWSAALVAVKLQ